jgi:hypothetical protein
LQALIEAVPYTIHIVLTDNGIQFGDMLPAYRPDGPLQVAHVRPHLPRAWHRDRLTKPNHPWTNGQVERKSEPGGLPNSRASVHRNNSGTLWPFLPHKKKPRASAYPASLPATFRTRTWQRYWLPHQLPSPFGGLWRQCRAEFRCSEASRLIGECVIENGPIGGLG